jgi:uncharacterized caspase-like protein
MVAARSRFLGLLALMIRFLCPLLLVFFFAAKAAAEQPPRLALLIGNQSYASAVGILKNPHQDVALIEASLKRLGFTVTVLNDAGYRAMEVALNRYVAELRRAGRNALGFFYYSGHGAADAETQTNYLIPVDVASAEDETFWYQSFRQNQIIDLLSRQAANATQFVVLDACRNELRLSRSAAKAIGADKGFVPVADTAGLLIAYATAPGKTASDVGEGGGAYAKALAEELVKPGVEAVMMFRTVQIRVKQATGQDPWVSFPSLAPVYLAGPPPLQVQWQDEVARLKERVARIESQLQKQQTALESAKPAHSPKDACVRWTQTHLVIGNDLQSRRFMLEPAGDLELMPVFRVAEGRSIFHRRYSLFLDVGGRAGLFQSNAPRTSMLARDDQRSSAMKVPVFFVGRPGGSLDELKDNADDLAFAPSAPLDVGSDFSDVNFHLRRGGPRFDVIRPFFLCGLAGLLVCEGSCPAETTTLAASLVNDVLRGVLAENSSR